MNYWRSMRAGILVLVAVLVFGYIAPVVAAGNQLFVDPAGNNTANNCLASLTPCQTLDYAITQAAAEDTINLAAGTYDLSGGTNAINVELTIQGPNAAISPNGGSRVPEAIILGSGAPMFNVAANATFRGLRIETTGSVLVSSLSGTEVTLDKNIFTGDRSAAPLGAMFFLSDPNLTVTDNLFTTIISPNGDTFQLASPGAPTGTISITGNTWDNFRSNNISVAGGALNLSDVAGTISGNTFHDVDNYGILAANASNLTITGNTFDAIANPFPSPSGNILTLGAGVRFFQATAATTATITGNTFSNSYLGVSVRAGSDISTSPITIENNAFLANTLDGGTPHNILNAAAAGSLDVRENFWGTTVDADILASISGSAPFDPFFTTDPVQNPGTATLVKPLVVSVDSDGAVLNLATSSPRAIKIAFDRDIATAPTVTVNAVGQTVTDCADGDAKTFCFDFTIPSVDRTTETIAISAAVGVNGETIDPDSTHTFVVDTVVPTFTAARTGLNTIVLTFSENVSASDAATTAWTVVGGTVQSVTQPANEPTLTITTSGITGTTETPRVAYIAANGTVVDQAGNEVVDGAFADATDAVAPILSPVVIRSNNANPSLAKIGDEITVFATSTEALATATSTIATQNASVVIAGSEVTATFTMTGAETEGVIPFTLSVSDAAGNFVAPLSATTNASSVTFDKTAPAPALSQPFTDSFVRAATLITFPNYTEKTNPECAVAGTFSPCVTGVTTLGSLTGFSALADGPIVLSLRDTDLAGNEATITRNLTKDVVSPTATDAPAMVTGDTLINSAEYTAGFDVSVSLGTSGAQVGDTLELLLGGSSFPAPITSLVGAANTYTFTIASGQLGADGAKTITARVTDQAGNLGPQSAPLALTLDTVAPTAAVSYSTSTPVSLGQTVTITATFSEAMAAAPVTQISISGSNTVAATNMTLVDSTHYTFDHTVGAGDGIATVALGTGTDLAGNPLATAPTSGATFVVDNTVPTITPISIASSNGTPTLARLGDTITLTFGTTDTNAVRTPVVVIKGAAATVSGGPTNWTASRTVAGGDTSGAVPFTIDVSDEAGNGAATASLTTDASAVTIDLVAPALLEITPVATPTNDTTPNYTFSTTEAGTISYGGDCLSATTAASVGGNTITFSTLLEASHTNCTVTVTDTVGNASLPLAVSAFVVDTTAPAVTSVTSTTTDGNYKAGTAINLTVNFSEAVSSAAGLTLTTNAGGGAACSTGAISNAATATCTYTVAAGENSADLDVASIAGTITDAATNSAVNPVAASTLASTRAIVVDTVEPTVVSVATSKPDGFYPAGTVIDFTVTLSEPVVVTGSPQIALNTTNGGFAIFNSGSGTNTLTLRYTVGANQNSADLDYTATNSFGTAGDIADLAGNNNGGSNPTLPALPNIAAAHAIVIDTIAPTATPIPTAPAGPFINAAENAAGFQVFASTTGSGAVAGDTLELLLGGSAFPTPLTHVLTAPEAVDGFIFTVAQGQLGADGVKSITSRVVDQATNTGAQSSALSLTLDTVAPAAPTLTSIAGDNKINNAEKAAIVVLGSTEANALVDISLTDTAGHTKTASQQLIGGATAYSFTIDGTTATPSAFIDGVITPNITATDAAGNVSLPTVLSTVLQDTIAPAAPVVSLSNPVNLANVTTAAVTGTGEGDTVISISITDGTLAVAATGTTTSPGVVSVGNIDLTTLAEGTVTASVTLTDSAGNVSIAGSATATKDTIIPVFSAVTPADGAFINNVTTGSLIGYTLSEALSSGTTTLIRTGGAADAATHTCVLTGNAKNAGSHVLDLSDTANSCVSAETLVDGAIYSIAFVGTDVNFNTSVTTTRTNITFDITNPTLTVTEPLPSVSTATSLVLRVSTDENATCSATLDGVRGIMTSTGGTTHTKPISGLSQGAHTIGFDCADPATNVGVSPTENFTVLQTVGSTLTATTTNIVLNSVRQGDAALPSGITDLVFSDTNLLDVSARTSTASGGTIVINGVSQDLANITTGVLVGENLATPRTIGDQTFSIAKAVHLTSGDLGSPITLVNQTTRSSDITVSIPDDTTVFAPATWDGTFKPARTPLTTTGGAPSGLIATAEVDFGANASLIFSRPVTITFGSFTPTNAAYKTAGSDQWVPMSVCTGTFSNPTIPAFANECYIRDTGTATKIVTFHLTAFGNLVPDTNGANGPITSGGGGGGGGGIFIPASTPAVNVSATSPGTAAIIGSSVSGGSIGGSVLGVKTFRFLKNLSYGMTNSDVVELQKVLIAEGLLNAKATGYFGPLTRAAVISYQKKYKITPQSGFVGPLTRGRLNLVTLVPTVPSLSATSTATSTSTQ